MDIYESCKKGTVNDLKSLDLKDSDVLFAAFYGAVDGEQSNIIDFLISSYSDWEGILITALDEGRMKAVKLIMGKRLLPLNKCFRFACLHGKPRFVRMMLCSYNISKTTLDEGLMAACQEGFSKLVQLLIARGAKSWDDAMLSACDGNHIKIIKKMIARGAEDFDGGLFAACKGGYSELIEFFLARGADDWNYALCGACEGGQLEIAKTMMLNGANNFNNGLDAACGGGKIIMARFMIINGATDFNKGLRSACKFKKLDCIILMLRMGAFNHGALKTYNISSESLVEHGLELQLLEKIDNDFHRKISTFRNSVKETLNDTLIDDLKNVVSLYSIV